MDNLNGIYSAYLSGKSGQGFVMLVFRNDQLTGVDIGGVKYDGSYKQDDNKQIVVTLTVAYPPNALLVQGVRTGPEADSHQLQFTIPANFLELPFVRVEAKHGPVNVKFVKLRDLND